MSQSIRQMFSGKDPAGALRNAIRDEQEAVTKYDEYIGQQDNPEVIKVLESIRDEEKVHIGELEKALSLVDTDDPALRAEGQQEAQEIVEGE